MIFKIVNNFVLLVVVVVVVGFVVVGFVVVGGAVVGAAGFAIYKKNWITLYSKVNF